MSRSGRDIRVVIVDDSAVTRKLLAHMLETDPRVTVAGTAANGEEAVAVVARLRPDVVTMDVTMPGISGFEATRLIMERSPVPIVIVTASWAPENRDMTFQAVRAGALTILEKPKGPGHLRFEGEARQLIDTVRAMADVKVVTRRKGRVASPAKDGRATTRVDPGRLAGRKIVAIGISTGGPAVLHDILAPLPATFPVPIVVVQHIPRGFSASLAAWLDRDSDLVVTRAGDGDVLRAGRVYIAPGGCRMTVAGRDRVSVVESDDGHGPCPSVAALFASVADSFGRQAVGILLTGMGSDGAVELKRLRDLGATTIAQDRESSVVFGMPGEAVRLGAAEYVLRPDEIARALRMLHGNTKLCRIR